jgi:hypothetical protein
MPGGALEENAPREARLAAADAETGGANSASVPSRDRRPGERHCGLCGRRPRCDLFVIESASPGRSIWQRFSGLLAKWRGAFLNKT